MGLRQVLLCQLVLSSSQFNLTRAASYKRTLSMTEFGTARMPHHSTTSTFRVCVIGGGAGGIITAFQCKKYGLIAKVFEKEDHIGGVWKYRPPLSVMYSQLRTNLPKEIMIYGESFEFGKEDDSPSFVGHDTVLGYLEHFASSNGLTDEISFSSTVTSCAKINSTHWEVTFSKNGITESEYFDAVAVCNGHYSMPFTPALIGIQNFRGKIMHSRDYDGPEDFFQKQVLVVGTKSSGTDMAREISAVAMQVHVSDRTLDSKSVDHGVIIHHPSLVCIRENGDVEFADGSTAFVDTILWCTGFLYEYPFLSPETLASFGMVSENKRSVPGLYKQLFSIHDPTITFMGLPFAVVPFPLFNLQAIWMASIWSGSSRLPSKIDQRKWLQDYEEDLKARGLFDNKYHYLGGDLQWDYCRDMAEAAGVATPRLLLHLQTLQEIYRDVSANKPAYPGAPDTYRDRQYRIDRESLAWCVKEESGLS